MKIGIFGSGIVGQTLATKLDKLGHEVMMSTRNAADLYQRKPAFKTWHEDHPAIRLGNVNEAAAYGHLLINALQGLSTLQALKTIEAQHLNGKIMLDIANPLDFSDGFPPTLSVCNTDSLGEQIQRAYPDLKVVKSLNTMNANLMTDPRELPHDQTVFLSGNDEAAKTQIKELLASFGWKLTEMFDLGDITTARGTEQLLPIWVRIYSKVGHPKFNFRMVGI